MSIIIVGPRKYHTFSYQLIQQERYDYLPEEYDIDDHYKNQDILEQ